LSGMLVGAGVGLKARLHGRLWTC